MKTLPVPMACFGTEPFWGLAIEADGTAHYKDDLGEARFRVSRVDNAAGRPAPEKGAGHALIFDEGPACSDSDSDQPPSLGILLERGDGLLRGCCRAAGE